MTAAAGGAATAAASRRTHAVRADVTTLTAGEMQRRRNVNSELINCKSNRVAFGIGVRIVVNGGGFDYLSRLRNQ